MYPQETKWIQEKEFLSLGDKVLRNELAIP